MPIYRVFYIYFIAILQKYMACHKFLQKYTSAPWPTAVGASRIGPVPRRGPWRYVPDVVGHGGRGLTPGVSVVLS
jgi:hypothetical protein